MDGGIICGTCDSISLEKLKFTPREMPVNCKSRWTLQGKNKIMPATSLEKASRLQLKELEAINKDRKSSILSSVHMLGSSTRRMEENCSLQVGAKQEGGREGRSLCPSWQQCHGAALVLQALGCWAQAGAPSLLQELHCHTWGSCHGSAPLPAVIQQTGIISTELGWLWAPLQFGELAEGCKCGTVMWDTDRSRVEHKDVHLQTGTQRMCGFQLGLTEPVTS